MSCTVKKYYTTALLAVIAVLFLAASFSISNLQSQSSTYAQTMLTNLSDKTPFQFTTQAPIRISIVPWLGLILDDVTITHKQSKVQTNLTSLQIKLNPWLFFLHEKLEIDAIRIDGLKSTTSQLPSIINLGHSARAAAKHISVNKSINIEVINAHILWETAHQTLLAKNGHLHVANYNQKKPFTASFDATISGENWQGLLHTTSLIHVKPDHIQLQSNHTRLNANIDIMILT